MGKYNFSGQTGRRNPDVQHSGGQEGPRAAREQRSELWGQLSPHGLDEQDASQGAPRRGSSAAGPREERSGAEATAAGRTEEDRDAGVKRRRPELEGCESSSPAFFVFA